MPAAKPSLLLSLLDLQEYWVKLVNLLFSFLAIFHLTYLGSMFGPDVDDQAAEEVRQTRLDSVTLFYQLFISHKNM